MIKTLFTKWKLNKAAIQFKNNDLSSAQRIYEEILKTEPNNIDALIWLGSIHSENGQYTKAFKLLEIAISANPNRFEPYFNLGLLQAKLGRDSEAIQTWQKALDITKIPKLQRADFNYNISRTLINLKEYGKAMDYANKALNLKPNYLEAEQNKMYAFEMLSKK